MAFEYFFFIWGDFSCFITFTLFHDFHLFGRFIRHAMRSNHVWNGKMETLSKISKTDVQIGPCIIIILCTHSWYAFRAIVFWVDFYVVHVKTIFQSVTNHADDAWECHRPGQSNEVCKSKWLKCMQVYINQWWNYYNNFN